MNWWDLAVGFGPDNTNSYSLQASPAELHRHYLLFAHKSFSEIIFFKKPFFFCLTRSIFMRFPSLQYVLLFSQSQVWNNRACGGWHPIPACSLWEGKQVWILPQEINQRCCCPPQCKLFIFSPEYSAVLLFYTAVNDLDTVPVESPYYFVMENRDSAVEIYNEWTGTSSSNCK